MAAANPTSPSKATGYIRTEEYKITKSLMLRILARRHLLTPMLILAAAAISLAVTGFLVDLRLVMLAALVLFVALPLIMAFVYIFYAFNSKVVLNIVEHFATFGPEEIEVVWRPNLQKSEQKSEDAQSLLEQLPTHTTTIKYEEIARLKVGLNGLLLVIKPSGFLYIPYEKTANSDQLFNFLKDKIS